MFAPAKFRKLILLLITILSMFIGVINAQAFIEEARSFTNKPDATLEQNQEYIVKLNQFIVEGNFSSAEFAEILFIRGVVFSKLNDTENALKSYEAAIKSNNLIPILLAETYKNRGLLYYGLKQYENSTDDFENALKILAGNAELHYYLANSYSGQLYLGKAIAEYENALQGLANNRFLAYYGIASIYYSQKNFPKAKEYLQKSLEDNKGFGLATNMLNEISKPLIPTENIEVNQPNTSKELTSNEIFNQLLNQAAKQKGNKKSIGIKLDTLTTQEKKPAQVLKKSYITEQAKNLDGLLRTQQPTQTINEYYVQLSSSNSRKNSNTYYNIMLKKHPILLKNKPYIIREFKSKKTNYQLLLSGYKSYKQADTFCKALKAQNSDCFVRRISK